MLVVVVYTVYAAALVTHPKLAAPLPALPCAAMCMCMKRALPSAVAQVSCAQYVYAAACCLLLLSISGGRVGAFWVGSADAGMYMDARFFFSAPC
jgi:hypothetical protein